MPHSLICNPVSKRSESPGSALPDSIRIIAPGSWPNESGLKKKNSREPGKSQPDKKRFKPPVRRF